MQKKQALRLDSDKIDTTLYEMADSENETLKNASAQDNEEAELNNGASFFPDEDSQDTVVDDSPEAKNADKKSADALEAQIAEWKAKVVYLSAEIENMRKRFTREKSDLLRMASEDVLRNLLPVYDNMSYALKAARDSESSEGSNPVIAKIVQGVEMTLKHFEQTLEQQGVAVVPTVGIAFDPVIHEAVGQTENPDQDAEIVSAEVQKGFKLYARVLRPARVLVNKK